ncbi:NAD(P)H-binding protein [Nakamurella sp. YIM 132087]|uniref:NAD(P)H-binding protein n=1 Tax=Nakamurella alba TaxID=2665158 RepID=A0A7K1FHC2_9ACTN|nr:SDR family oxidoreductase [Nakamurella alba]MTD13527.1 NAD(P)H-binding protein [Nakamurella alba]
MTITIAGAAGQLGAAVIDGLLDTVPAADVIALVRTDERGAELAARGVTVRVADYDDAPAVTAALADADRFLLISGSAVGRRFEQHRRLIDAAVAGGASLIAYTSVLSATGSINPVAPEHQQTEAYLAEVGVPHVLLRNGWYSENYAPTVEQASATGVLLTSAGDGRVASASRADYAGAAVAVLTTDGHAGRTYELSGDLAWTQDELAATIAEVTGKPVAVQQVSGAEQQAALVAAGLPDGVAGFVVGVDAAIAKGELGLVTGDLSALLGHPTTPLADTLKAVVAS